MTNHTKYQGGIDANKARLRNAATILLIRDAATAPRVLMGQRGARAAFMPNKFVFPGGAVDPGDAMVPLADKGAEPCRSRLSENLSPGTPDSLPHALLVAAIRELWEETGQILGTRAAWPGPVPEDWASFAARGYVPSPDGLAFICRAITPPGNPRRFDARFFVADAARLASDPDDFSGACEELSNLQWIAFDELRNFDLPFITQVALAEIKARLPDLSAPPSVPFFKNNDEESLFLRLRGKSPLDAV